MKQVISICIVLIAMSCFFNACSGTIEEVGELCANDKADRGEAVLDFIVLANGKYCTAGAIDPECDKYQSAFKSKTCPAAYPYCSMLKDEYYCGEACLEGFVACAGRCIDPLSSEAFCGADMRCKGYVKCDKGLCVKGQCTSASACEANENLCLGACVDPLTNALYCGAKSSDKETCVGYVACQFTQHCADGQCVTACPKNEVLCGDLCYDLTKTVEHCGQCGNACVKNNVQSALCVDGECQEQICSKGFMNCDGHLETGCEVDVQSHTSHCGSCGNDCLRLDNVVTSTCNAGICAIGTCKDDFADCDADASNGCEASLSTTKPHCNGGIQSLGWAGRVFPIVSQAFDNIKGNLKYVYYKIETTELAQADYIGLISVITTTSSGQALFAAWISRQPGGMPLALQCVTPLGIENFIHWATDNSETKSWDCVLKASGTYFLNISDRNYDDFVADRLGSCPSGMTCQFGLSVNANVVKL